MLAPGLKSAVVALAEELNPNSLYPGLVHSLSVGNVTPVFADCVVEPIHTGYNVLLPWLNV